MVDATLISSCLLFAIFCALIVVFLSVYYYSSFIVKRNRIKTALAQIDVYIKKRTDSVHHIVDIMKGYAKHEEEVFENVAKARNAILNAKTLQETALANNMMVTALKNLFAIAEAYPQLKANENFRRLQEELSDIEGKIAYSRQFYNDSVYDYNNSIMQFPGNIFAKLFKFDKEVFFRVEEGEKAPVKVE